MIKKASKTPTGEGYIDIVICEHLHKGKMCMTEICQIIYKNSIACECPQYIMTCERCKGRVSVQIIDNKILIDYISENKYGNNLFFNPALSVGNRD